MIRYFDPRFLGPDAERPVLSDKQQRHAITIPTQVTLHDGRERKLELDHHGVVLSRLSTTCDMGNEDEIRTSYYDQVATHVAEITGADHVLARHHLIRTENPPDFTHAYARFAHADYDYDILDEYWKVAAEETGIPEPQLRENYALCAVNTWQPVDRPALKNPLAIADYSTIAPERDVLTCVYTAEGVDQTIYTLGLSAHDEHEWLYWPDMQVDEMLIFKQLETRADRSRFCFHTSFDDPNSPPDAPSRRSIEVRCVCLTELSAAERGLDRVTSSTQPRPLAS